MPSTLFTPHPGQMELLRDFHKISVTVCGRRWGKTSIGLIWACMVALDYELYMRRRGFEPETISGQNLPVVLIFMPTLAQARQIYWEPLVEFFEGRPETLRINRGNYTIRLHGNRPPIYLRGADRHGDRLRGLKIAFCVSDEFQDVHPHVLDQVIIPAMADHRGSQMRIFGTPKGKSSHFYNVAMRFNSDPDSYSYHHFFTKDNPYVPLDEIERARKTLSPRVYRQEYEASWEDHAYSVYPELDSSNLTDKKPTNFDLVVGGLDWGSRHPAFSVFGRYASIWYLLEAFSPDGTNSYSEPWLFSYIHKLCDRHNISQIYADPAQPNSIISCRLYGIKNKCKGMTKVVAANNRILDGIQSLDGLMYHNQFLIYTKMPSTIVENLTSEQSFDQIKSYHWASDKKTGSILSKIEPQLTEHHNDANRYALHYNKIP